MKWYVINYFLKMCNCVRKTKKKNGKKVVLSGSEHTCCHKKKQESGSEHACCLIVAKHCGV